MAEDSSRPDAFRGEIIDALLACVPAAMGFARRVNISPRELQLVIHEAVREAIGASGTLPRARNDSSPAFQAVASVQDKRPRDAAITVAE